MDRNCLGAKADSVSQVALRKESVDRNKYVVQCRKTLGVALRKESVDRNVGLSALAPEENPSLSARRAWIEIIQ